MTRLKCGTCGKKFTVANCGLEQGMVVDSQNREFDCKVVECPHCRQLLYVIDDSDYDLSVRCNRK